MSTLDFDDDESDRPGEVWVPVDITVNGRRESRVVAPRTHLVDFVRDDLGLTGSHTACEHGVCGACTLRLDGIVVRGCLVLAVQADGCRVETVEGLTESGAMRDLQDTFVARNALQCGFCTPGMLMAAAELIETKPDATRSEVREWISGNYCRCTGYHAIVDAICTTLAARRGQAQQPDTPPEASIDDALHATSPEPRGQADLDAVGG